MDLDPLLLARWQYAITTVYHFLFVPITIGMSTLVAVLQTAWLRTGKEHYLRATKFWGKLFLINFAMGVVTGIVQEFQFGMNWSDYSRFVGDIFGAPLAIEGLLAFFLESTFLGLWIFGWDRLPKKVHLACIWLAAIGTMLSAYFILSANSWMQHPVGYRINPEAGRAELTDIAAVLTQNTAVAAFTHTITAAFLTAAAFMIGVCAWHLARRNQVEVFRPSLKFALVVAVLAGIGVGITGDWQAKIMTQQQPMKMASAEALWESTEHAPFSLFAYGDVNEGRNKVAVEIPSLLSWLSTADPGARVEGINDLQQKYQAQYGPGDYRPNIPVAYWSFRLMIGTGMAVALFALVGLWLTRRGRLPANRWVWRIGIASIALPLIANSLGWIFTEMGRQPWTVFGVLQTSASVSPGVSSTEVLTSLVVFTVLYGVLAVIEAALMVRYAKAGAPEIEPAQAEETAGERPLTFAY